MLGMYVMYVCYVCMLCMYVMYVCYVCHVCHVCHVYSGRFSKSGPTSDFKPVFRQNEKYCQILLFFLNINRLDS